LIGEEFIKIFSIIQSLCTATHNDNINNQLQQFIEKNYLIGTSNNKSLHFNSRITLFDANTVYKNDENENLFSEYNAVFNDDTNEIKV
jgi:hypothetical protein